jgi:hypothetical protein
MDPDSGIGTVNFNSEGRKSLIIEAVDTLQDGSKRAYQVAATQTVEVEKSKSLACVATLNQTKATSDPKLGDLIEATVDPIDDDATEVEIVSFNPGFASYDVQIDDNEVAWRYSQAGRYEVSGICRDRATGKIGKIYGPDHRIVASEPLSAEVRANRTQAYTGESVVISAHGAGGLGNAHITGIVGEEDSGLKIVRSDNPQKWVIKFSAPSSKTEPHQLMVEVRDEIGAGGECLPPHCTQAPLAIKVSDPAQNSL